MDADLCSFPTLDAFDTPWGETLLSYTLFSNLPLEVRQRIYSFILGSEKPILPHLCDTALRLNWALAPWVPAKFHDGNGESHGSVFKRTGITRASRKLREESLPVFYSTNLFGMCNDLSSYLAYLEKMGRLGWVHHVELVIRSMSFGTAAVTLRGVHHFDKEVERYQGSPDTQHRGDAIARVKRIGAVLLQQQQQQQQQEGKSTSPSPSAPSTTPAPTLPTTALSPLTPAAPVVYARELTTHPRYNVSGLSDLNLALLLRMLSTTSPPTSTSPSPCRSLIVLPVSNTRVFATDPKLRGLATLARGLDMELRFVERPGSATREGCGVVLRWDRRYQGRDVETVDAVHDGAHDGAHAGGRAGADKSVMQRALEMCPELEDLRRPVASCFYRRSCDGRGVTWYTVPTIGGEK